MVLSSSNSSRKKCFSDFCPTVFCLDKREIPELPAQIWFIDKAVLAKGWGGEL